MIRLIQEDLQEELRLTRKMLAAIPEDKLQWQPHEKSMNLRALATHIAQIPSWLTVIAETDLLDFANMDFTPPNPKSVEDIQNILDKSGESAMQALEGLDETSLEDTWTLANAGQIIYALPRRAELTKHLRHLAHHRGQLSVYLRLLEAPVPGMYGASADER